MLQYFLLRPPKMERCIYASKKHGGVPFTMNFIPYKKKKGLKRSSPLCAKFPQVKAETHATKFAEEDFPNIKPKISLLHT